MQQLQSQNEQLRAKCLQLEKNAGSHDASANGSVNGETKAMCAESSSKLGEAHKSSEAPKGADTPPPNAPLEPGHALDGPGHDI